MQRMLNEAQAAVSSVSAPLRLERNDARLLVVDVECSPLGSIDRVETWIAVVMREVAPVQDYQRSEVRLRLLGCLASSLSHEIRNPLNAIFLHLDIVDEELHRPTPNDRTQVVQSLATIKGEVIRLHDLIQDYLFLARLSDLQLEPEDGRMFLEAVARDVRDQLAARGIFFQLEGLEGLGEVALHKSTLHRALVNVVQHAVEAMPRGGTLTLRGWRTPSHVHFAVHHTGDSLKAQAMPQTFSSSPTAALAAENLRLYVVQEIVAAHGGVLEASSASDEGTTFTMTLPSGVAERTI
jgi:signal transduction histidine kinase